MDKKVILIVILVVAGAILFAASRKGESTNEAPPRKWVSGEEISLTAKVIIGELDEEAMEALPSDLKPNTDGLTLTDEEKTELFAILNSVTDSGVLGALGSASPLGASAMQEILKIRRGLVKAIDDVQRRKALVKKQIAKTKSMKSKLELVKRVKKYNSYVTVKQAQLKTIDKKIEQLKAKETKKNTASTQAPVAEGSSTLKSLMDQAKALGAKYHALLKNRDALKKNADHYEKMRKAKRISPAEALKRGLSIERKYKLTNKSLDSVRKSIRMLEDKIKAEKRRMDAETKANMAKARETKKARDKEEAANKQLEQSKAKAAAKETDVKRASKTSSRKVLDAKRHAEKAEEMALTQKALDKKLSESENARLEYEEAQAKKTADALAKKEADVKDKEDQLEHEAALAKESLEAQRKQIKLKEQAQVAELKEADAKQRKRLAEALAYISKIPNKSLREKAMANYQKQVEKQDKKLSDGKRRIEDMSRKNKEILREKALVLEFKYQKHSADILHKKKDVERHEAKVKKEAEENATKAAQVAADQKQRELDQKKRDEQARALKQKELALEREKEAEKLEASAALEKAKKDVADKEAHARQTRLNKTKAQDDAHKHRAEQTRKANMEKADEQAKGIKRITGMSRDSLDLSGLDKTVLMELLVFIRAWPGPVRPMISPIIKMIELKSKKEEEEEQDDEGDDDKPMTEQEKRMKEREEIFSNMKRITGIANPNGPEDFIALELEVLEELLGYAQTLTSLKFAEQVKTFIFVKKLMILAKQNGITLTTMGVYNPKRMDWDSADIAGLDKIIEFLKAALHEVRYAEPILLFVEVVRGSKMAQLAAERDAAEKARAKKQAEELEAIEKARVAQAEKDLAKAAAKLEQDSQKLDTEIVKVDQAVSAEKQRVVAEHQKEVESIEREHEEEKQVVVEEIKQELKEAVKEIQDEAREKAAEAEAAAENKFVEMKATHDDVENGLRTEAMVATAAIEAEIENAQDPAVIQALKTKLDEEQAARARVMEETEKAHALEKQAIAGEAKVLKREILKSAKNKIRSLRRTEQEKLESAVETVEQEKQDLIEMKEKIQEIEVEKVDLEGAIQTDVLEQEKRNVEEDKEIVDDTTTDDLVEELNVHPRASKEDTVTISRKNNPNGSSFIKMSVPSDLSPGESDTVAIFLSKEVGELLAQYHQIHKKIGGVGSLSGVSADDKKVLALAGAEFKRIREQYVQQRKEKVLARRERLAAKM